MLTERGHRVSVLAVDPSSSTSGGEYAHENITYVTSFTYRVRLQACLHLPGVGFLKNFYWNKSVSVQDAAIVCPRYPVFNVANIQLPLWNSLKRMISVIRGSSNCNVLIRLEESIILCWEWDIYTVYIIWSFPESMSCNQKVDLRFIKMFTFSTLRAIHGRCLWKEVLLPIACFLLPWTLRG